MNNPFDYIPDAECKEAFGKLTARLNELRESELPADINFCRELDDGKMLGVLIAADSSGAHHTLYAFSGQLGEGGFHHSGFVEPAFDYLEPGGYFKTKEAEITRENLEIAEYKRVSLDPVKREYESAKKGVEAEISDFKEKIRLSRLRRDERRETEALGEREREELIRQSQFEKAELRRLKKRLANGLLPLSDAYKGCLTQLDKMKEKRRSDSEALQNWLFSNFRLKNARGESRSLSDIFAGTSSEIPPSGAGECCAPKLLQAAYTRGWIPLAIAEYWYGKPKDGEVRIHGESYPACRGKCLPVLNWMLQGLDIEPPLNVEPIVRSIAEPDIIYENEWFCVVNKPGGMLSVPGKGESRSLQDWLVERYRKDGIDREVKMAHRLDQDTSGLIIATFGPEAFREMQAMFATRRVRKTYVADLDGDYRRKGILQKGRIELPLSPDWLDRPRQRVDYENGKEAVTEYEFIEVESTRSRIEFHPITGRTHQLRVHAASEAGLGMPIAGDRLYGKHNGSERLHLHAQKIDFTFTLDGRHYSFESPLPF